MRYFLKTNLLLFLLFLLPLSLLQAQDYAESADQVTPLLISSQIPDVSLTSIEGETVNLRNMVSQKPTILVFYRGGWCPYCNRHLSELQKIEDELYDIGYQLVAISPDRPEKLKTALMENELNYTLLSDSPMEATKAFGIAFKVDQKTVDRYKSVGIDLEADSGYDHHLLPAPAVYILNTDGMVKFNYINPNYRERINGDVLLTAAKAYYEE
ncbi:MAG: antioxidant AhpC [Balneola sp.]|jgi:peroxiredoxin|nr:antioxidant AhpC [Balneola sp.]MBE78297.1 antioxidant AhpC [Balneola sp.]|tara:strand:+ start:1102 stop:1737 length:636 start_codon:yes stop_codon:yes gene_type:complete